MNIEKLIESSVEVYKRKIEYEKAKSKCEYYGGYGLEYEYGKFQEAKKIFGDALIEVINSVIDQRELSILGQNNGR